MGPRPVKDTRALVNFPLTTSFVIGSRWYSIHPDNFYEPLLQRRLTLFWWLAADIPAMHPKRAGLPDHGRPYIDGQRSTVLYL